MIQVERMIFMKLRSTFAVIDREIYRKNIRLIQHQIGKDTGLILVLKDNAYGLGATELARIGMQEGVSCYAVANLYEALELRKLDSDIRIIVLGYINEDARTIALQYDIDVVVWTKELALSYQQLAFASGKQARIHIKVDTGLSRLGFLPNEESLAVLEEISKMEHLTIVSTFSHFACTETDDDDFSRGQLSTFLTFVDSMKKRGIQPGFIHMADSAGIVKFPESHLDFVRCGALAMGSMTGMDVVKSSEQYPTEEIISLYSQVARVQDFPKGTSIGYDGTYFSDHDIRVVTVPMGYGDGLSRELSNSMQVIINGKKAKSVGAFCMDMAMFDATGIDCKEGDTVTILGQDGNEKVSLHDWTKLCTSSSTFLQSMLRNKIPKEYK